MNEEFLPFNPDGYTYQELTEIRDAINQQLADMEKAAKRGEWNSMVQSVKSYIRKYGCIDVWDEARKCHYLDETSFGGMTGTIRVFDDEMEEG